MTRNEFNLLYTIKKVGMRSYRYLKEHAGVSTGFISQTMKEFADLGYITSDGITEKGIEALLPYKVNNAVIMAAGMSTRFVPISLEIPKGLLTVKGEVLIERQIKQLQEAGINEIVIVLGYKKEAFFYLEEKFEGIKIIVNPEYNIKNNTHTLYLAKEYITNTYICSSDDYFTVNPFEEYVYQSYYASEYVNEKTNEWYMIPDTKMNIARVRKSGKDGFIMIGHAYWDKVFSRKMVELLKGNHDSGDYDQALWEQILADYIKELSPIEIKEYRKGSIFEFDSLDELREFDDNYVNNTHSTILKNISKILKCRESDILNFKAIKEGLTNTSFVFEVLGERYVYRHPGEGTNAVISRAHEKKALELAKTIEVDPTYIYMNETDGWKISKYIAGARIPCYNSVADSKRILKVLRELHNRNLSVDWAFMPWEEAIRIEIILKSEKGGIADMEFNRLKEDVEKCYKACRDDGILPRFCHCDTYAPNWMLTDDQTILIDWEYAGNADPGCDIGTYIMDSMWETYEAESFIREYISPDNPQAVNEKEILHYLSYTAIISFYWYVWALYREACGAVMGESLYNWHVMAKRFSRYVIEKYRL